jgi:hypothetical protein
MLKGMGEQRARGDVMHEIDVALAFLCHAHHLELAAIGRGPPSPTMLPRH